MEFEFIQSYVDQDRPLIYMWEIHDTSKVLVGRYVGKAKGGAERPLRHYKRNVVRLLDGEPYRKGNPDGYRLIHRALADAVRRDFTISLTFLCNVREGDDINQVESEQIKKQNSNGQESWQLNGTF